MDEVLDIVDGHDIVIGTINRKDYKQLLQDKTGYIRAAELFIMNDEGKLWVPVRTASETIAPNGYDYGAAGHVKTGDDYLETIIRETKEEAGLDITPDDIEFVAKMKSTSSRYIRCIYLLRTNQTPEFNPNDFVSAEWLSPDELLRNIENGHTAKGSLRDATIVLQMYLIGR